MAVQEIKNLSLVSEIKIEGTDKVIKVDFTDKRFVNRLLKLVKKYQNIGDEIDKEVEKIEAIEDELDKLIAFTDMENNILEDFKNDVDATFNTNLTEQLFGEKCLPAIERYYDLFDAIMPYVKAAKAQENDAIAEITKKYGLNNVDIPSQEA